MTDATHVTVAFSANVKGVKRLLHQYLDGKVVVVGEEYNFRNNRYLQFLILETEPDSEVVVTAETQLEVSDLSLEEAKLKIKDCYHEITIADGLKLKEHSLNPKSWSVEGSVANTSEELYPYVSARVTFYEDEEANFHLGVSEASTRGFKPNKTWRFEIPSPVDTTPRSYDLQIE